MSVIIFIIVLSVLVIVHEWGHFIMARRFGVRVERFSVGFGKKLWSYKRGDTEYMVCAVPLGGYVKMAGEDRSQCKGDSAEFYSKPVWQRACIVLMGPVTNFIFAFACFYVIFVTGFPLLAPVIGHVLDGSAAQTAGLLPGDRVTQIDSKVIKGWDDIPEYVQHSSTTTLRFVIERNGQKLVKDIGFQQRVRKNIFGQMVKVRQVGIGALEDPTEKDVIFVRYGVFEAFGKAYQQIKLITVMTFQGLLDILIGAKSPKEAIGGPIAIFAAVKMAAAMGMTYLLMIVGVISASLAIFNLFPIPVLDGGHLLFMAIESVRRKPMPIRWEENLIKVGFSLLICLMVFVFYNDMLRAGWFSKIYSWVEYFRSPH